jgi:hypothetical protein
MAALTIVASPTARTPREISRAQATYRYCEDCLCIAQHDLKTGQSPFAEIVTVGEMSDGECDGCEAEGA